MMSADTQKRPICTGIKCKRFTCRNHSVPHQPPVQAATQEARTLGSFATLLQVVQRSNWDTAVGLPDSAMGSEEGPEKEVLGRKLAGVVGVVVVDAAWVVLGTGKVLAGREVEGPGMRVEKPAGHEMPVADPPVSIQKESNPQIVVALAACVEGTSSVCYLAGSCMLTSKVPGDCRRWTEVGDGHMDPGAAAVSCQSLLYSLGPEADTVMVAAAAAAAGKPAPDYHKQKVVVRFVVASEAAECGNRDHRDQACRIVQGLAEEEDRLDLVDSRLRSQIGVGSVDRMMAVVVGTWTPLVATHSPV